MKDRDHAERGFQQFFTPMQHAVGENNSNHAKLILNFYSEKAEGSPVMSLSASPLVKTRDMVNKGVASSLYNSCN